MSDAKRMADELESAVKEYHSGMRPSDGRVRLPGHLVSKIVAALRAQEALERRVAELMISRADVYKLLDIERDRAERNERDAARIDWIEKQAVKARKFEIAQSLLGTGYEFGWASPIRANVYSGDLRAAIDKAMEWKK